MLFPVVFIIALCGSVNSRYISYPSDPRPHYYKVIITNGLKSIAQESANPANSVVAQQISAAKQAFLFDKMARAQSAIQAAAAANAALEGKHFLLENVKQKVADAERVLNEEQKKLEITTEANKKADAAVRHAAQNVFVLASAVNCAKQALQKAESDAQILASLYASQNKSSSLVRSHYYELVTDLEKVQAEYEETKKAAKWASQAAKAAQSNAAAAKKKAQQGPESISPDVERPGKDTTAHSSWVSKDIFRPIKWNASKIFADAAVRDTKDILVSSGYKIKRSG